MVINIITVVRTYTHNIHILHDDIAYHKHLSSTPSANISLIYSPCYLQNNTNRNNRHCFVIYLKFSLNDISANSK